MRESERDKLLFLLAASAGSADGWSFFGLGHSFVANMTGNTVLLGIAVFQQKGDLLHPFLSLACYAAGVTIACFMTRQVEEGVFWANEITKTLIMESLLMASAAAGWMAMHHSIGLQNAQLELNLLLACVALAIGLQSGAMLQLKVPGIMTTYITGTWTTLFNGLVHFAGKPNRDRVEKIKFEERLRMQAGILAVYFLSAVATGALFRYFPSAVGILPASSVLFVSIYGAARSGR